MLSEREFGRREVIKKGVVAGGLVWVTPVILELRAGASTGLHSRPPNSKPPGPPTTRLDHGRANPVVPDKPPETQLPFTGEKSDDLIIAGIAAVVTGGTLIAITHETPQEV